MKPLPTLSLCMIVKNEERYLAQCIDSVQNIVDEIILVDTGSTDHTLEIAQHYHAKIYHYDWDHNFSHARNFSISKTCCDWILLLDADEQLAPDSKEELLELIHTTTLDGFYLTTYNYTGTAPGSETTFHQAFRLLRNNGEYLYIGDIHEQIVRVKDNQPAPFDQSSVKIYHYGYLNATIEDKDKRSRNIPLIQRQLALEPTNAFYLYNLGNEYFAEHHFNEALESYSASLKYAQPYQGFSPNLYYRTITCLYVIKHYNKALALCDTVLAFYPKFTDVLYFKALILTLQHKILLAITAYNDCLSLGDSPPNLCFKKGCGTVLPFISLGDLYFQQHDYEKALKSYNDAIQADSSLYYVLYRIAKTLRKLLPDEKDFIAQFENYFDTLTNPLNLVLFIDILFSLSLYDVATSYLAQLEDLTPHSKNLAYLKGKLYFFTYRYAEAATAFEAFFTSEGSPLFTNSVQDSFQFLLLIYFITANQDKVSTLLVEIQTHTDIPADDRQLYYYMTCWVFPSTSKGPTPPVNPYTDFTPITASTRLLLQVKEFILATKLISLLKQLSPSDYHLLLAPIYEQLEDFSLAKTYATESIQTNDIVLPDALSVLYNLLDQMP